MEQQVQVGQEAAIVDGTHVQFGYTVVKVTPTGQVTVRRNDGYERRFNSDSREINALYHSKYRKPVVRFDVEALRQNELRDKKRQEAAEAINAIVPNDRARATWSKDSMLAHIAEIEALLQKAKALVEQL